jgi:hypothetical protein
MTLLGAESSLTENVLPPFQAEPTQQDYHSGVKTCPLLTRCRDSFPFKIGPLDGVALLFSTADAEKPP